MKHDENNKMKEVLFYLIYYSVFTEYISYELNQNTILLYIKLGMKSRRCHYLARNL